MSAQIIPFPQKPRPKPADIDRDSRARLLQLAFDAQEDSGAPLNFEQARAQVEVWLKEASGWGVPVKW